MKRRKGKSTVERLHSADLEFRKKKIKTEKTFPSGKT